MDPTAKRNLLRFLFSSYPDEVHAFRDYESSVISAGRRKNQLCFLRECQDEQVLPSSLSHLLKLSNEGSPFPDFARSLLQERICTAKRDVEQAFFQSRMCFDYLKQRLPRNICHFMADIAHDTARIHSLTHSHTLTRKLFDLTTSSPWSRFSLTDAVTNLSSHALTSSQLELLGFGLSFSFTPPPHTSIDIISSFDRFISTHSDTIPDISLLRGALLPALESLRHQPSSLPRRYLSALQSLRSEDISIFPSDKGNSVVILDRTSYLEKAFDLLADPNTYSPLLSDPRERIAKTFHRRLKEISSLCPDANLYNRFRVINPRLPHFYGLPKTHKPGVPLRPIISSRGSVTHPLASWLAKSLTPLLGTFSSSHLRHTQDFIERVRGCSPSTMLSLDVDSLFTNVPLDDVLSFLQRKLLPVDSRLPLPTDIFLQLIRLCVDSNSFSFEGNFYSQTFGVAMGSSLSPVLANLYMEYFESELLPSLPLRPSVWLRYVDDVWALWPHDPSLFPSFLEALNSLSPSIRFKVEWESENKLPFLDALVHRSADHFSFSVYRKPMHSGMYVHFFSHHPYHVKRSIASSLFLRALRICDPLFVDDEILFLRHSFSKLGYPAHVLDSALSRAKRTYYRPPLPDEPPPGPVLCLPHAPALTALQKPLRSLNVRLVFRQTNTLRRAAVRTSPPSNSQVGVYAIPCTGCQEQYFGETGAGLPTRIKQHRYAVNRGHNNNAIFRHQWETGHQVDWSAARLIHRTSSLHSRRVVEAALIKQLPNFNISPGFSTVDSLMAAHIMKALPDASNQRYRLHDPT